jgi:penicillin-binding protein 1A
MKRLLRSWLRRPAGDPLNRSEDRSLNLPKRSFRQWLLYAIAGSVLLVGIAGLTTILLLLPTLPSVENIAEGKLKVPMRVYSAEGRLIGEFGEERRIPVAIADVPKDLINAVLAAEDSEFYEHWGVDFRGVLRAALANLQSGGRMQGASTITMQVARNFFLSPEKKWTRKIKEALLAFKIEYALTKDEILELYFNKIFLGNRAYGFAAASQIYYGRPLSQLTLPEMAMLAGLPKAPSGNNPLRNPERAIERRNYVLARMAKLEYIGSDSLKEAQAAPISASKHRFEYDVQAPYVAEMVRQYMYDTYAEKTYAGGFHVHTTIRAEHQHAANRAVHDGLLAYDERHGYRGPVTRIKLPKDPDKDFLDETIKDYRQVGGLMPSIVLLTSEQKAAAYTQDGYVVEIGWKGLEWAKRYRDLNTQGRSPKKASEVLRAGDVIYLEETRKDGWKLAQVPEVAGALVSIDPKNGAILALTGGFDFQQSKFNRITQAERQPGSNIKPFLYSAALAKGYTAASTVSGAPIVIEDKNLEGEWKPENYSGKFFGPTRLRLALTKSMNLVSVRLLRGLGPQYAVSYIERFGFKKDSLPANLSLALGTASFKPIEVVSGFSVFANGGFRVEPYLITRVEDAEGNILEQANPTLVCPECPETEVLYRDPIDIKENEEQPKSEPAVAPVNAEGPVVATPIEPGGSAEGEPPVAGGPALPPEIDPRFAPRVISAENAFIMTTIMRDVVKHGTARRALALKRDDLAGKTGTTNEFRDAWFSGFNSNVVTTAWVGFDQPSSLGRHESGAKAALPIWIDFMRVALKGMEETELKQPENVIALMVDPDTGNYVGPVPDETEPELGDDTSGTDEKPIAIDTALEDENPAPTDITTEKAEPIKEYFIVGTEPKGAQAVATPEQGGADATTTPVAPKPPAGDGGLEGLF